VKRRLFTVTWTLIFAYELGATVWALVIGQWWIAVAYGLWAVVAGGMVVMTRASFRAGWLEGRLALLQSMAEAQKRGMTSLEWLTAEAERDGIPVTQQPVEPDDG
jgi:hypothetical protein